MKHKIVFTIAVISFIGCNNSNSESTEKEKIKSSNWLLGKWENKSVDGLLTESWKKINDSTYQGSSHFIKDKDTLHYESTSLQQIKDELYYNTTIKGQNNSKPINLNQTVSDEKQLIFENLKNDYPQKINYTKISENSFIVEISGIQQGKPSSEKYTMSKIK
ncbi:hypothetical protein RCH18_002115 [Flavobacterium sp. PL11]|uniref:DUF6265 family protein n=1 Tax=Flavobacterium sp. PL11 TaxID=3071717 RepID=UPI002DF9A02E|nr:hypothetical protein [Flavobacterium sp. PL11]